MLLPASLLTFVLLGDFACALRVSFEGRRIGADRRSLARRSSLTGASPLGDNADLEYTTNITVVASDLWVAGSVPAGVSTGKTTSISYASGGATGPVKTASLKFAGFTVPDQAFMEVPPDSDHQVGSGLIGLGPSVGSVIYTAFDAETEGNTVLDSIFIQNMTTPNYITFLLGRLNGHPTDVFPGDLTVGEMLPNYTAVANQPKLPVTDVSISNKGNQHFQILLDANGFIGPDGKSIPITSEVRQTSNKKQATVVIDTGFSLPQVPKSVSNAIYSGFTGAEFVNDTALGEIWILPCDQEVNITLKFGGVSYPVHPLDATIDPTIFGLSPRKNSKGENLCLGLFQPVSFDTGSSPTYDIIFGMAFLRSVYTLINFGDFVSGTTNKADPYIQFLSTTEAAEAHSDFVNVRLNGNDTTRTVFMSNSNDNGTSDKNRTLYYIIGGAQAYMGQPQMYQPPQQPMYNPPAYSPDRPYDPPATTTTVPYHNPWEHRQQ
ncbi:aspartic peptidase domain-containing protein [Mycena sp. CBHHK59/15]|nr:aspartic peptidase domain-containing protein [Mycena sp. CBHHK59/15]